MELDFVVAIGVFVFIIALVSIYITNYLSTLQVDILEYREKASEIVERIFSSANKEDVYINPKAIEKIKRIPIAIRENKGYKFIYEPMALNIKLDDNCEKLAWNSTIRVYDENLSEIPIKLSYQKFCKDQFLNSSIITFLSNISENSISRFFIYFSDNEEIVPKKYENFDIIAYYKFDENYGTKTMDYSGNEFNISLKNGTEYCFNYDCPKWVEGKFGYAIDFDGVNDYLDCSNLLGEFKTIEFWIKPNKDGLIMQFSSNSNIILENSNIRTNGFNSKVIYVNGVINGSVNFNEWNHVVIVTNDIVEINNCSIARVGNEFYNGSIDEMRIWKVEKNESYVIARNSSNLFVQVYPEEELEVVSSRRLNQIRNIPYDHIRSLLELNYRLRLEIAPR